MDAIKNFLGKVGTELKAFFDALWSTAKELADSKKAILTALASILTLLVTAYPELAKYQDVVYTKVDVALGILVVLFGLIDAIKAAKTNVVELKAPEIKLPAGITEVNNIAV